MNFESWFAAQHPAIPVASAASVLELAGEGATVPFIARYRKEKTGNLDEVQIRAVIDSKETFDAVIKRQLHILGEIDKQEKLTPELRDKVLGTFSLDALEDIYVPFKLKRKTKGVIAREAGLEPLADWLLETGRTGKSGETAEAKAAAFLNPEKKIADAAAALQGAVDIIVERLAETAALREFVRTTLFDKGFVRSAKGDKAKTPSQYENYFAFAEKATSLAESKNSHRYLALRRGWNENELVVTLGGAPTDETFDEALLKPFVREAAAEQPSPAQAHLVKAARLALKAHVFPSIENEVHKQLKDRADVAAIFVFSENLRNLLLASPFGPKSVLGIDPGIRTGCKVAVVDASGKFVSSDLMHLQGEGEKAKAAELLVRLVKGHDMRAVAVGNGTFGRETETFARDALKAAGLTVPVVMVSESGASVYSASEIAREEFPDLDLTVRGAISIARRLQDPLAELVKVDPKSIGVGQYQHDVAATSLKKSLDEVVDSCVNKVGVNLNTASAPLLSRVSGIGPVLARSIVEHRSLSGLFKSREDLLTVSRFTKKSFEQAAGFLRIPGGSNPLDNTGVHPERYPFLEKLAARLGKSVAELLGEGATLVRKDAELKSEIGEFTFADIVSELEKPGRDPREAFVTFAFRDDIREVKDLKPGLKCPGIVTNVTNFGAFVDIGVHQDGLVHISQLADRFVQDPHEVVKPGDHVEVRVMGVNLEKNQISLTMRNENAPAPQASGPRPQRHDGPRPGGPGARDHRGSQGAGPRGHGGGRDHRDGPRGGHGGGASRPQFSSAARPASGPAKIDPNSPFAKLAALRDQLGKAPSKK